MHIEVECHSADSGESIPRRFFLGKHPVEVTEVIDRWLGSDHRYFKVQGDDGAIYLLRHDTIEWAWNLTMFARSPVWNADAADRSTRH